MLEEAIPHVTQLGVAGLMGVLWVWERMMSRKHETQLDAAHAQLTRKNNHIEVLVQLVRQNTTTIERFEQTQKQMIHLLEKVNERLERT